MADMSRRRAIGGGQAESRKRKLNENTDDRDTDEGSTTFPCHYCSAVFVTQISLSRHVLTYHDGQGVKDEFENEEFESLDTQENFDEAEPGYYDNGEGEYYYDQEQEEMNQENLEVDISEYLDPNISDSNPSYNETNGVNDVYPNLRSRNPSPNKNPSPTNSNKTSKAQLSSKDLESVLAQVEELTSVTTSEFVTCPICRKTFGRKELPIHIACEHGGAKFTCPYCSRNISRRDHLKRHIKNVHPDKCTETEIGPFPRNLNLSRASTTPQKQGMVIAIEEDQPAIPIVKQEDMKPAVKTLPISIVAPRTHMQDDEEEEDDDFEGEEEAGQSIFSDETQELANQEDSMHITVEPDLPFQDLYDNNDDLYHTPSFLLDSLDQYQQKLPSSSTNGNFHTTIANMAYQCSLCNAVFSSKTLLDRHESTHSELRPHKCSLCGKGFLRKEHLSKHLSSVHSGMKFTCEFCGKDISRKDHLIRHIRNVHPNQFYAISQEGEQQDLYTQAQQQLQSQQLQLQIQTAALKTAQSLQPKPKKPFFNCDMCEATFVNVDDLHAHQSTIHSDVRKYKCNYCCKAFKRKEHLTKHEVLHTGERKFNCRICGSEFPRKDALQDHIRRTHGIDPNSNGYDSAATTNGPNANLIATIPCNLCDQLFQDRGSLLSHMTSVHGLIVNSPPGLPKNSQRAMNNPTQQQRQQPQAQPKPTASSSRSSSTETKALPSLNGKNLGSLMDLINKGSITLSYHPIKSE